MHVSEKPVGISIVSDQKLHLKQILMKSTENKIFKAYNFSPVRDEFANYDKLQNLIHSVYHWSWSSKYKLLVSFTWIYL